ncbi:probable carboxylesterase 16 [Andrographis paniculata]|uniref:probable carboxylesterase 16 n=1 Tax=Andrographis paniculata TaxID=175694 RepID=UPI0021E87D6E|nr:probable carboxylesterase 16 [Andrographis paniculata]
MILVKIFCETAANKKVSGNVGKARQILVQGVESAQLSLALSERNKFLSDYHFNLTLCKCVLLGVSCGGNIVDYMERKVADAGNCIYPVKLVAPVLEYKDAVHEFATLDILLRTPQAHACGEDIAILSNIWFSGKSAFSMMSMYQASKDDLTVHCALSKPPPSSYINVTLYNHIEALMRIFRVSGEGSGVTIAGSAPVTEVVPTPPAADNMNTVYYCWSQPV